MSDWLRQLHTLKAQAVQERQQLLTRGQCCGQLHALQLHEGHVAILTVLQRTAFEDQLLEIACEIVAEHPEYPNAYVQRAVSYGIEETLAYVNIYVDDPWQGYLWDARGRHPLSPRLPACLTLPRGFYLSQIHWHFHLKDILEPTYRVTYALLATLTPCDLEVNAHPVQPLTYTTVQQTIARGIENPWKTNVY